MQTDMNSWKSTEDCSHGTSQPGLTCDECGRTFQKPILARVSTTGNVQTYQACPHCMTRIYGIAVGKSKKRKQAVFSKEPNPPENLSQSDGKCTHSFGYLNKRQKGAPIPEQCLICAKMLDCLYG